MKKEDILMLSRLIKFVEEEGKKLEESYHNKNYEGFNISKKNIMELQKKIINLAK